MISTPSPTDLKKRVLAIHDSLPSNYLDLALIINPDLKREKIIKVKALQDTDEAITNILEKVAASHKEFIENLTP